MEKLTAEQKKLVLNIVIDYARFHETSQARNWESAGMWARFLLKDQERLGVEVVPVADLQETISLAKSKSLV